RVHPRAELIAAYRHEREEPLAVDSDFSFWNGDEAFAPNREARDGRLASLIVGATVDGAGFEGESLEATYRRHQLASLFGERLAAPEHDSDVAPRWRLDWTSEVSSSGALGGDFDFTRHILVARTELPLSRHQAVAARAIAGWSTGALPPQRLFSAGGIGSVHGYDFKEQTGDSLALGNLEYALGDLTGLRVIGFVDAGRATDRSSATNPAWLKGTGFGIGMGSVRLDFGYQLDRIPSSLQFLLRFTRNF
ncbi:MAG TPA: BamA/TamA family outer membrane protein, partial [Vicinamibacterales bacterium]|nr:BamA/TamA family outer membrane protein [Vicinamibacterales bacterium]